MSWEYHIAAVGESDETEVSLNLTDVLNTLGAQDWELTALPRSFSVKRSAYGQR